jgi:pyruvate dehydrogenase complex dehydrogenase (E1) component
MLLAQKQAQPEKTLTQEEVRLVLQNGLADQLKGQRVLVLIPDHTRTLPLPFLFRELVDILKDTRQLDFMVAKSVQIGGYFHRRTENNL